MRIIVSACLLITLIGVPASAVVVFDLEITRIDEPGSVEQVRIVLDRGRLALESGSNTVVYLADQETLIAINHEGRRYTRIDRGTVEQISARMNAAMKVLEAQLADMSPERRAMMEQMMGDRMPTPSVQTAPLDVRKTTETGTSGGYDWTKVQSFRDGELVMEHLVADWGSLGVEADVFSVFEDMAGFFTQIASSLGGQVPVSNPFGEIGELDGFPVVTRRYEDGQLESEVILKSVDPNASIPESTFEPPSDYREESPPRG